MKFVDIVYCQLFEICGNAGGRRYGPSDTWGLSSGIGSYYGAVEDGGFYGRPPFTAVRSTRDLMVSVHFLHFQETVTKLQLIITK